MATVIPSIACLGVIGRNNNPLHLTILPSYDPTAAAAAALHPTTSASGPQTTLKSETESQTAASRDGSVSKGGSWKSHPPPTTPLRTPLQFSLLLSQTLDVFELRARQRAGSGAGALAGDLGLLCAVDERLSCYGFETNTGVKFVAIVDMRGRLVGPTSSSGLPEGADMSADAVASFRLQPPLILQYGIRTVGENNLAVPALPPLSGIGLLSLSPGSSSGVASSLPLVRTSSSSTRKAGGSGAATGASHSGSGGVNTQHHEKIVASLAASAVGLRESEVKPLFRAVQTAWVRLLQNPFFELDDHVPPSGRGGRKITSKKFGDDMKRLAAGWAPGVVAFDGF